ncbi:MAG: MMPL family transporter [Pseudomonadota bacterium]
MIAAIGEFEASLRGHPFVGGVLGPYSHLEAIDYLAWGRDPERGFASRSPEKLATLWRRFEQGRGERRRQEVASDDLRAGLLTVYLKRANYDETRALMSVVEEQFEHWLAPYGAQLRYAGDVAISQNMIRSIVVNQVRSLVFAIVVIFCVLLAAFGRLREAMMGVLPVAVSSMAVLGVMGWVGIPLGVATSMFCAIAIGIGTDFQVHLLTALRRERSASTARDVARARARVAPAVITDCLVIALGFGLLSLSGVPANARLGALVAMAVVFAGAVSLLLFPAIARFVRAAEPLSTERPDAIARVACEAPEVSRVRQ